MCLIYNKYYAIFFSKMIIPMFFFKNIKNIIFCYQIYLPDFLTMSRIISLSSCRSLSDSRLWCIL